MNAPNVAATPKNTALRAANSAGISVFATIGTAADSVNAGVAAIGRVAQAADIRSSDWLLGIQAESEDRRHVIVAEAALKVRTESGNRFMAHLEAMKQPEFAKAFNFVDKLIADSKSQALAAQQISQAA